MGELRATEPWETVSIDFLANLPTTARGNKHLLVCCDHFTRLCDAFCDARHVGNNGGCCFGGWIVLALRLSEILTF